LNNILPQRKRYDGGVILTALIILLAFGTVMVFSSSGIYASDKYKSIHYFLMKQVFWIGIGSIGLIFFKNIRYDKLRQIAKPLFILAVLSLFLVFVPHIGKSAGGAKRWISVAGFTFEPSELLKLAFIIYIADAIERKQEKIKLFVQGFLPFLFILGGVACVLLLQPDVGSIIMLVIILAIMLFVAGIRISHVLAVALPLVPLAYIVVMKASYRSKRIKSFLESPWADPQGIGFQMVQSFIAFGSGGIFGKGLGNGTQKLFYLPESHTDFIFAIVGEEMGLAGATGVLLFFGFIIWKGIEIATKLDDVFGKVLAVGITSWVGLQAFVNMAVVTGLLPTKGLTLPFISYGGSSLLVNMMAIGLLLNLAKQVKR